MTLEELLSGQSQDPQQISMNQFFGSSMAEQNSALSSWRRNPGASLSNALHFFDFSDTNQSNGEILVKDSQSDYIDKLAADLGLNMSAATRDYLTQYILNEKASENAWNRSVFSEKNKYQWAVNDLKKAGINPYLAISGLSASGASSSAGSVSGGLNTQIKASQNTLKKEALSDATKVLAAIIAAIGLIVAA